MASVLKLDRFVETWVTCENLDTFSMWREAKNCESFVQCFITNILLICKWDLNFKITLISTKQLQFKLNNKCIKIIELWSSFIHTKRFSIDLCVIFLLLLFRLFAHHNRRWSFSSLGFNYSLGILPSNCHHREVIFLLLTFTL